MRTMTSDKRFALAVVFKRGLEGDAVVDSE
jgi:hypothetical protein